MAFLPIPQATKIKTGRYLRQNRKKVLTALGAPKKVEFQYRRALNVLVISLRQDVRRYLIPVLKQYESEYVADAYAKALSDVFENLESMWVQADAAAKSIATAFTNKVSQTNSKKFNKSLQQAAGVDLGRIVSNEGIDDILFASTEENISLIKSIPEQYHKQLESIVYNDTVRGNSATSIIDQIMELGQSTQQRAKVIARDQTSKLNAALTQQRQMNAGIEEYVWRTVGDNRVRATHAANNGKTFRWDTPPKETGHPGQDIQCRCVAQPVINLDDF